MDPGIAGALIGAAAVVAVALYGGSKISQRRKAKVEQENRAREAARTLSPEIDSLRIEANEALRTNRADHLPERRAKLEEWSPSTRTALAAGLDETQWTLVQLGIELMERSLTEDFFPKLPGDGTVGRDAAVGALNCSLFANNVLFVLEEVAADPTWVPQRKLDALVDRLTDQQERFDQIPRLHPEFERWLREEGKRQADRRAKELEEVAAATVPAQEAVPPDTG
jgi:hypothetical protein